MRNSIEYFVNIFIVINNLPIFILSINLNAFFKLFLNYFEVIFGMGAKNYILLMIYIANMLFFIGKTTLKAVANIVEQ